MKRAAVSFNTLVVALVLGVAVLPLGAVGAWLAQSAVRSGETLLTSELDLMLDRVARGMEQRWEARRGNLLLLARNVEVGRALAALPVPARDDSVAQYLGELHASMRLELPMVLIRDAAGVLRWRLADTVPDGRGEERNAQAPAASVAPLVVREPIAEDGRALGELEAHVPLSSVVPVDGGGRQVVGATVSVTARDGTVLFAPSDNAVAAAQVLTRSRELERPAVTLSVSAPLAPYVEPFRRVQRVGTVALLSVAALTLLLTAVLSRRLTGPLSSLASAADSVARGSLEERVQPHGPDEVQRVARAFNAMTENLRATMDTLARQRSLAAVGEFASSLAHEVRNALTAVRVDVQRARRKSKDEDVSEVLERALTHVQHMDRVVSGALQVARSGHAPGGVVDIDRVLGDAQGAVAERLADAQVSLVRSEGEGALHAAGDAASLRQLFTNVILNAVEASRPGDVVRVAARGSAEGVVVEVHDRGNGIAAAELDRIWEPLFTTKPNGTGLGLPIARQIARAHGGDLRVESSPGEGTTVQLTLPAPPRAGTLGPPK